MTNRMQRILDFFKTKYKKNILKTQWTSDSEASFSTLIYNQFNLIRSFLGSREHSSEL